MLVYIPYMDPMGESYQIRWSPSSPPLQISAGSRTHWSSLDYHCLGGARATQCRQEFFKCHYFLDVQIIQWVPILRFLSWPCSDKAYVGLLWSIQVEIKLRLTLTFWTNAFGHVGAMNYMQSHREVDTWLSNKLLAMFKAWSQPPEIAAVPGRFWAHIPGLPTLLNEFLPQKHNGPPNLHCLDNVRR